MAPFILSLSSALMFLGVSMWVYGADAPAAHPWVSLVLVGLLASGLLVALIARPLPAWLCALGRRLQPSGGRGELCRA